VDEAILILHGLKGDYEKHHGITYESDAVDTAARLAGRYINDRFLPDKAIDVLDEAGAAKRLASPGGVVTVVDVENTVASMAKIPPRTVTATEETNLATLSETLKSRIFGQDKAVDAVTATIKLNRAGLGSANKPVGSFLFSGPTGVGKTELAKQIAEVLGVGFIRFDMSEYMEEHTVSRLIGAPPGYVGFEQEGLLTGAVSRTPHAVLVLDEIEKAHPKIYNVLLQVMDHASLTDNNGKKADFRNIILVLTTNAGAREGSKGNLGFSSGDSKEYKVDTAVARTFPPEFRNRLDGHVIFGSLSKDVVLRVVDKFLVELGGQLVARDVVLETTPALRDWLGDRGYKPEFGAREMSRVIAEHLKKPLADELLFGRLKKGGRVIADVVNDEVRFSFPPVVAEA
jgi:ATP-dependent Clp protease ATP-binding subunit ClpA